MAVRIERGKDIKALILINRLSRRGEKEKRSKGSEQRLRKKILVRSDFGRLPFSICTVKRINGCGG